MAFIVNERIDASFQILDNSDVAVTGLTEADFDTFEAYLLPSGATTAILTLTEVVGGNGEYAASFTPTVTGVWAINAIFHEGQLDRRQFTGDYEVESAATVTSAVIALGGVTTTLAQLREDVARELGDCLELVATEDASNVTLKDARRIQLASNAYAGREAYFASGTPANVGEWRFVTSSDPSSHTINFDPELPADTTAGDRVLLFNERGRGFSKVEYDSAINRAIRFARNYALIDQMATLVDPFDAGNPVLTIPSSFLYVSSVEYLDGDDLWQETRRASSPTSEGWFLLPGRAIRLTGNDALATDGATIRVIGQGSPAELASDDDETAVDAEWLVMQAAAYLDRAGIDRSKNRDRERTMQYRQNLANELLPSIVLLPRPNGTRVT
jgi:hypothetical protein